MDNVLHPIFEPIRFPIEKPNHIVLCPDGSRRYALNKKISVEEAYHVSMQLIFRILECLIIEKDIKIISVYLTHPTTHLCRPQNQVDALENTISGLIEMITKNLPKEIKTRVVGNINLVKNTKLRKVIHDLEFANNKNASNTINLLVGYSGREELEQAFIKAEKKSINEVAYNLWIQDQVHLVVRSGGIPQLGDMLYLQSWEARNLYYNKLFPELTLEDIEEALKSFNKININGGRQMALRCTLK
jgi:undecaprenyl diphosphate synthase